MAYEFLHLVVYLLVFAGAAMMRSWRGLGLFTLGVTALAAVAGPLILDYRADLPGRGGWDALGDAILAVMLAASCLVALLFQALRLRMEGRGSDLAPVIHAIGLFASPVIAVGAIVLPFRHG